MHTLLGYSWAEIASILAVISVLFSGIYWLIRHGAKALNNAITIGTYPLQQQFIKLSNTINRLNNNLEEQHKSLVKLEDEVEKHHDELIKHDKRIESLERDIK
ncbi:hypothetical protein [Ligilactobacillus hayakitensis]|uniref:hypothetical protein n=1 Tax=Ligilactobacillus hayakitensis TaxID=396716 RepID=UPI0004692E6E|nr:hypothetical protein [Ligilactobacillus hayakitensis]